ncbi:alpha/beta fold hydrolase [Hyphococcus sp.]|uniref:alpha/beta fold hydrolase n=1 Tax=Hyphococcus sp. TaxID=2038636 RepID=UPI003D0EEA52
MTAFWRAGRAAFLSSIFLSSAALAQQDAEPAENAPDVTEEAAEAMAPAPDIFARDTFRLRTIVCPFKGKIDYKGGEISCSLLEVPENREKARSRMIELHVVKLHARQPDDWDTEEKGEWTKREDPIVYLTGGPGAQAAGYVDRFKDHGIRDARDLYILEQRGIGWSADFCQDYALFDPSAANSPDWATYQQAGLDAMDACFAKAKAARVDLSGYNTIENARDVHALRQALGFDQWNVWGISYGSILGQAYLKQDPEGIRAAVIDAIVPLQQDVTFHHIARYYDRDLNLLEAACQEDGACAKDFPNLVENYKAAIRKAAAGPIEIDAIDKELYPSGKAYIFHDLFGAAPFSLFYEQKNYPSLPAFIAALTNIVEEENYDALRLLTAGGPGGDFSISQGMYNAISCNDGWAPMIKKAFEEDGVDYPVLSMIFGDPSLADQQEQICRRYGANARPAEDYLPVETNIRTLIVEGQMDPITPPPLAQVILPGFSNGTYVEFPYAGHGPTRSVKCAGDFLNKFYDNPEGELDLSCPESMERPEFAGPMFETSGLTRLAANFAADKKSIALPALWIGLAALIFFFGALIYTFAPVARVINRSGALPTGGARLVAWLTSLAGAGAIGGIAAGAAMAAQENPLFLFVGLPGWTKLAAMAGLAAGPLGLLLLWLAFKARMTQPLPIGVTLGLLLTGAAGVALAAWIAVLGFLPF